MRTSYPRSRDHSTCVLSNGDPSYYSLFSASFQFTSCRTIAEWVSAGCMSLPPVARATRERNTWQARIWINSRVNHVMDVVLTTMPCVVYGLCQSHSPVVTSLGPSWRLATRRASGAEPAGKQGHGVLGNSRLNHQAAFDFQPISPGSLWYELEHTLRPRWYYAVLTSVWFAILELPFTTARFQLPLSTCAPPMHSFSFSGIVLTYQSR